MLNYITKKKEEKKRFQFVNMEMFLFVSCHRCDKQTDCVLVARSFFCINMCVFMSLDGLYNNPQAIEEREEEEEKNIQ
jgi:uncharacterized protein (UPF0212 family)